MSDSLKRSLLSLAFRLYFAPFLAGGIVLIGICVIFFAESVQATSQDTNSVIHIAVFLLLMPIGAYLGALLGYICLMAGALVFVTRPQFDRIVALLPQEGSQPAKLFLAPISFIGNFFYVRLRSS